MKKYRFLCCIVCLVFLCACDATRNPSMDAQSTAFVPELSEDQSVRVILPMMIDDSQQASLDYANQIIADAGFSVTLEGMPKDISMVSDEFLQMVRDNLSGNAVSLVFSEQAEKLADEGILGDFYAAGTQCAPMLMTQYAALSDSGESMTAIPVSISQQPLSRTAVLIRNDVYASYGKEIRTADDYRALLESLKENNPGEVPGTISPQIMNTFCNDNLALSLFLPEYGYAPCDDGLVCKENNISAVYSLDETSAMLNELEDWKANGLVDFFIWDNKAIANLGNYPTMVTNTQAFLSDLTVMQFPTFDSVDYTNYHMCILYPTALPQIRDASTSYVNYCAVASPQADITEFLNFLEWLQTPENYLLFTYGKEGVDYTLHNGNLLYTDAQQPYGRAIFHFLLKQTALENLQRANVPSNLMEEVAGVEYPYVLLNKDAVRKIENMTQAQQDQLSLGFTQYSQVCNDLLTKMSTQPRDAFTGTVDDFVRTQRENDPLGSYVTFLNGILSSAGEQ